MCVRFRRLKGSKFVRRSWFLIFRSSGCHQNVSWSRRDYWCNGLKSDIVEFVAKCPNFQQVKAEHQRSGGLSRDIAIPTLKWEDVNMDFFVGFPHMRRQNHSIWVIVDGMTKSAHFIPVKATY